MNSENDYEFVVNLLPEPVRERLKSCPRRPKKGVHDWLIETAVRLHHYLGDEDCIAQLLRKYTSNCGREVDDLEIWNAVDASKEWLEGQRGPNGNRERTRKWPEPDEKCIESVVKNGPTLAQLTASSPVKLDEDRPRTEEIIDQLFPGNPWLCVALDRKQSVTFRREDFRGALSSQEFLVPSTMSSQYGKTKAGKDTMRSKANTGPRRFLVVEFDDRSFDEQAAIHSHLSQSLPLVMVVHSGGKSLHGWFYCVGTPDEKVEEFFREAVLLGADRATWTRSQLVRMPDGLRDGVTRQRVVYFNPSKLEVA